MLRTRRGIVLQMIGGIRWFRARHWVQQKAGLASTAGGYWIRTVDGHGFRTTVAVRPRCSATINGGVQEVQQPEQPRAVEHSGEDAARQIEDLAERGDEHSVLEQLKAAAEFRELFDDIPQPPSDAEAPG